MRKIMIALLSTFVVLSLTMAGCSDNDNGNGSPTGPQIDPEEYGYYFVLSKSMFEKSGDAKDSEYMVVLSNFQASEIQSAELKIDGENIPLMFWQGSWGGYVELSDDYLNHDFDLTIDETNYQFNLDKAVMPNVDWPDTYVMSEGMELNWTLDPNVSSDLQQITGIGHAEIGENENKQEFLESDERSFFVPANWFDEEYPNYSFTLDEINYIVEDDLLAMSVEIEPKDYDSKIETYSADEKIQELIAELQNR